jgi:protocatechuate 3,4-dioxygenase beta subunit
MKTFSLAVMVVASSVGAGVACAAQVGQSRETQQPANRSSASFGLDDEIPVDVRVCVADADDVVRAKSIRFTRIGDEVRAAVRIVEKMAADAKWRVAVEILDGDDDRLAGAEEVLATQEFMRLSQASVEGEVRLWLEPSDKLANAARFVLTLERAPDEAAVTTGLRRAGPIADRRGGRSLEVKVVDAQGQPVEAAYIRVWRAIEGDDDKWQGALISYPNNPRAVGQVWNDPVTERTWEPYCDNSYGQADQIQRVFDKLRPGEYRVTAVRALRDRDPDCTPVGVSEIVRVERGGPRPTVTVRLEDGATLQVNVSDASTGKPLEGASVLLTRADGFPLGAERRADADGVLHYAHLAPGTYWLYASKTVRGHQPADHVTSDRVRVDVEARPDNRVALALKPVFLAKAEVQRRWPWCVVGRVTDDAGNPVEGVEIKANCGAGTLRTTDLTFTDADGRYTLRPMPGIRTLDERKEEWRAGAQAATIFAHKDGYYEANLCRHGGLVLSDDPHETGTSWGSATAGVLVPNKPYQLDFLMAPGAIVKARLVDESGQPIAGVYVSMDGEELPPSSSALACPKTDDDGRFTVTRVPCKPYWFTLRHAQHVWPTTEPIDFAPGIYELELTYERLTADSARLSCKLISAPK